MQQVRLLYILSGQDFYRSASDCHTKSRHSVVRSVIDSVFCVIKFYAYLTFYLKLRQWCVSLVFSFSMPVT